MASGKSIKLNRKPRASVKKVIKCWETGGIDAVKVFLNEAIIFKNSWSEKIKNLIDKGHIESVNKEIELVSFNLDLENRLYNQKKGNSGNTEDS